MLAMSGLWVCACVGCYLLRQGGFSDDGEEGVPEDGGVVDVPEEGVVGVGADSVRYEVDARVDDVSEAVVGGVGDDGLEEAEYVEAADAYALKELLDEEQVVEGFVGSQSGLVSEVCLGLRYGKKADIKKVRDEEVLRPSAAKEQLASGETEGDLEAEILG